MKFFGGDIGLADDVLKVIDHAARNLVAEPMKP